jgi:hypothetical protein
VSEPSGEGGPTGPAVGQEREAPSDVAAETGHAPPGGAQRVTVVTLTAMVVGSMVGAGVFSLRSATGRAPVPATSPTGS